MQTISAVLAPEWTGWDSTIIGRPEKDSIRVQQRSRGNGASDKRQVLPYIDELSIQWE